jgi:hypothetical protein
LHREKPPHPKGGKDSFCGREFLSRRCTCYPESLELRVKSFEIGAQSLELRAKSFKVRADSIKTGA